MNSLRLTGILDDDGTMELHAQVEANGFSGKGSAWFNPRQIVNFASELEIYPFPLSVAPSLAGGYWSKEQPSKIEQEHLFLCVSPIGARGELGVRVRLAAPLNRSDRPESRHAVEVELQTTYQELGVFAKELRGLATGEYQDAVLPATAV